MGDMAAYHVNEASGSHQKRAFRSQVLGTPHVLHETSMLLFMPIGWGPGIEIELACLEVLMAFEKRPKFGQPLHWLSTTQQTPPCFLYARPKQLANSLIVRRNAASRVVRLLWPRECVLRHTMKKEFLCCCVKCFAKLVALDCGARLSVGRVEKCDGFRQAIVRRQLPPFS